MIVVVFCCSFTIGYLSVNRSSTWLFFLSFFIELWPLYCPWFVAKIDNPSPAVCFQVLSGEHCLKASCVDAYEGWKLLLLLLCF